MANFSDIANHSRASTATYVDSDGVLQTAAINEPRIGHHIWDGSAWVNQGLLLESEARTNSLKSSDDLSNASYWGPLGGASTPTSATAIGGAPAWTLSGAGYLRQTGLALSPSTKHTAWLRMRLPSSPSAGKFRIRLYDLNSSFFLTLENGSTFSDFIYDTSGVVTRDTSAVDFLVDEEDGVYLVGAAFTTLATVTSVLLYIYPDVASSSQSVEVATPQLEAGSTPSSYIPTSGATATRAAETLTIPAANLPYSATAMSIAMQGKVTYADEGVFGQHVFYRWFDDSSNNIQLTLDTLAGTGGAVFSQSSAGTSDVVLSDADQYSPGVNVPFNIASRHGSTFINGAVDGTALTENTTPTALPDLSTTDLQLGSDFMGTIKTFRMWADDISDVGIEEASS